MIEGLEVRRLGTGDMALARQTFQVMAAVFDEPASALPDAYLGTLLARGEFWAFTALSRGTPIGGITAHALPMTRTASRELFIYDLAVDEAHQRRGVGRTLVSALRTAAAAEGIAVAFVPADDDDAHALAFYAALEAVPTPVTLFTFGG